ncbi:MAG: OsmC family protein [Chloroflexota bacterium]
MTDQDRIASAINSAANHLREHPADGRSNDAPATATLDSGLRFSVAHPNGTAIFTDMPAALGGEASDPSPGWLMRAAAAACVASMIGIRAAQDGVALDRLEVTVRSVSDDRGMVGADDSVSPGLLEATIAVLISASGVGGEALQELVHWAHAHSPVTDSIGRAVPTTLDVKVE